LISKQSVAFSRTSLAVSEDRDVIAFQDIKKQAFEMRKNFLLGTFCIKNPFKLVFPTSDHWNFGDMMQILLSNC
jgi:hypothetical protein